MIVGFVTLAGIVQVRFTGGDVAIGAFLAFFRRVRRFGGGNRYHGATKNSQCNQYLEQLHGILLEEQIVSLALWNYALLKALPAYHQPQCHSNLTLREGWRSQFTRCLLLLQFPPASS